MNSTSTFTRPRILSDYLLLSLQNKKLRYKSYTEPSFFRFVIVVVWLHREFLQKVGTFCTPQIRLCHITFVLHAYGLTFMSGGVEEGGGVKARRAAKPVTAGCV